MGESPACTLHFINCLIRRVQVVGGVLLDCRSAGIALLAAIRKAIRTSWIDINIFELVTQSTGTDWTLRCACRPGRSTPPNRCCCPFQSPWSARPIFCRNVIPGRNDHSGGPHWPGECPWHRICATDRTDCPRRTAVCRQRLWISIHSIKALPRKANITFKSNERPSTFYLLITHTFPRLYQS